MKFPWFDNFRLWPLIRKEVRQILRNRQIIFLLIFPPTVQLLVFGLALNPDVTSLSLGVTDYSQSASSRELVSALVENNLFELDSYLLRGGALQQQVRTGDITAGLIIPPDFDQRLAAAKTAEVPGVAPLFVLLMGDVLLASAIARLIFGLPFRGSYLLFLALSALYVLVTIGIGILLATLARNQQQVILISFFFNVPIIQLSGAISPIESMPPFFDFCLSLTRCGTTSISPAASFSKASA